MQIEAKPKKLTERIKLIHFLFTNNITVIIANCETKLSIDIAGKYILQKPRWNK